MIEMQVNTDVILQEKAALEAALSSNPKTQKTLQRLIQKVIKEARDKIISNVHFDNGDPRQAIRSIRRTVYKKILGANINIYNRKRKAGQMNLYEPPRKQRDPHARGGNRMKRSARTQRMMSYGPNDRAMVLRWVNSGTGERISYGGNRKSIAPRHWFEPSAQAALTTAADNLANMIDIELAKIMNKKA